MSSSLLFMNLKKIQSSDEVDIVFEIWRFILGCVCVYVYGDTGEPDVHPKML